jgi:hypothetical protein
MTPLIAINGMLFLLAIGLTVYNFTHPSQTHALTAKELYTSPLYRSGFSDGKLWAYDRAYDAAYDKAYTDAYKNDKSFIEDHRNMDLKIISLLTNKVSPIDGFVGIYLPMGASMDHCSFSRPAGKTYLLMQNCLINSDKIVGKKNHVDLFFIDEFGIHWFSGTN